MGKRVIIGAISLLVSCLNFSGCVFLPWVVGAAGGYAVSKDTIAGEIDADYDTLWDAAMKVSEIMGVINLEDKVRGRIDLNIGKSKVVVIIEVLTPKTMRLKVKARKYLLPNIALAQKMFVKITQQIN